MKFLFENNLIVLQKWFLIVFVLIFPLTNSSVFAQKSEVEKEIWQLENRYWNYLERNDSTSYKKLWIHNQINYQSDELTISDVKKCSYWMNEINEDSGLEFSCTLHKKAIEITENAITIHYDVDKFWTDKQHNIHKSETFSFSHTWIKIENSWLLSDGIAIKN
ncbi:MAG: nuclear transport factor 2 family protein [Bacteroidetes bacterium HGW-Bacteroidetes-23]|nr:MAG: nuclear transport factor 2 family protein [Bacteroidetes bacterium HGW-Bacteroidetes-23]